MFVGQRVPSSEFSHLERGVLAQDLERSRQAFHVENRAVR